VTDYLPGYSLLFQLSGLLPQAENSYIQPGHLTLSKAIAFNQSQHERIYAQATVSQVAK
jgi:hypothetical protein